MSSSRTPDTSPAAGESQVAKAPVLGAGAPNPLRVRMTVTLDAATAERINSAANRLGTSKSRVVEDAVRKFAPGADRLSESERLRFLKAFDELVPLIPPHSRKDIDAEIPEIRRARRPGGRRTPGDRGRPST